MMLRAINIIPLLIILMQFQVLLAKTPNNLEHSSHSYLTATELDLYRYSLEFIEDVACHNDLNATLWGLLNGEQWATSSRCLHSFVICFFNKLFITCF